MTIYLKGFVEIQDLIDNEPSKLSVLGELSTWCETYTKNKTEFANPDSPGYRIVGLSCKNADTGEVEPSTTIIAETIEVVKGIYAYAAGHLRPYDTADFEATIKADFISKIYNFQYGSFVDNGNVALPEWVYWESVEEPGTVVQMWLADAAFRTQYDEYEITVIPPFNNVDDFFANSTTVLNNLKNFSFTQIIEKTQTEKDYNPETYLRFNAFEYINPDSGNNGMSYWGVLIYGTYGDNIDAIKQAIQNYILARSAHTRAEWTAILPDLFETTEFVILPRWDKYAIPNKEVQAGIHSSYSEPNEVMVFAKTHADFYNPDWVTANITIMPFNYKDMTLIVIDGPDNIANKKHFVGLFPDYIPEATTSLEFNRMTAFSQDFFIKLEKLIIAAETATKYSSLSADFRKIWRNNKLYLSMVYDNVDYLVAANANYGV